MSNQTSTAPREGKSRRRRSRGGNNRNRSNNRNRNSEDYRPKGPRPPRNAPVVQLTWWQKFLQAIGLYKAPASSKKGGKSAPTKSNTRNARSSDPDKGKPKCTPKSTKSRGGDPSTVESARVYVGNLSYEATEHDLEELFKGVGGVRSVEIVYNRSTHRSKGYAFVEMLHKDDAVRSVEVLHDQPFMGRNMIVSGAKNRTPKEEENESANQEAAVVVAPVPSAPVESTDSESKEPVQGD